MQDSKPNIFNAIGVAARLTLAVALGTAGVYLVASDIYLSGGALVYLALWLMGTVFEEGQ